MMVLRHEETVNAPAARCFDLMRSVDVHRDTARSIQARVEAGRDTGVAGPGDQTTWSAVFFGWRFRLTTRITEFSPPGSFSDELTAGVLRQFAHRYSFDTLPGGGTRMVDCFLFESPFRSAGALWDHVVLKPRLVRLLTQRNQAVKRLAESEEWKRYLL